MRNLYYSVALSLTLTSCADSDAQLTDVDRELVVQLGFDQSLMLDVLRFGESFEQMLGITPDFESVPTNALILLTAPNEGRNSLIRIRTLLSGTGYSAYLNDEAFGYDADRIAIVRGHDEYEYLSMVRTDGINYDLEHENVLSRYRLWDEEYGLSLVGAGLNWLEADLETPPRDWLAFAEEVYEFCPDVVDQGTGDVESLADEMRRINYVYLWWD